MTQLSPSQAETARNNERAILHALAAVSQKKIAELSGVSESRLSRVKDGGLEQYCAALAAMGLKVVPADARIVTPCEYKFMAQQMVAHYQGVLDEL